MDTLFFYFYGSARRGWQYVCRGLGFAGFPPLHSLPFVPCSAQITHKKNPFPPSHPQTRSAQIQGLPRSWTLIFIAKPSGTWFLLPSNHFLVLSRLGLLAQALVSCCILTPPIDSVAWDVLAGEVSTHTHTHTHTHLQFPHSEILCENNGNCGNPCCLSMNFFWKIDVLYCFFILGNIGFKRQNVSGKRNVPRRPWKYNLLSWQWAKYLLSLLGLSFPLHAAFMAFKYIKHSHRLHEAQPVFWSYVLGRLTAAHSVLLFAQLDMSDRMSSSLQRWA